MNKQDFQTIVHHRYIYTKISGVDYNSHQPKTLSPLPPTELAQKWNADYRIMQEHMIYGESPTYQNLIIHLNQLLSHIHQLNWQLDCTFPSIK